MVFDFLSDPFRLGTDEYNVSKPDVVKNDVKVYHHSRLYDCSQTNSFSVT